VDGTPDSVQWYKDTIHVAATGGDTTPGMHSFVVAGAGSYLKQWGGVTINIDATTSVPFFSGSGLGPTNNIFLEDGFYYSFRVIDPDPQEGDPLPLAVMKTSAPPVSLSRSGQTPPKPTFDDPVAVSIVTSQPNPWRSEFISGGQPIFSLLRTWFKRTAPERITLRRYRPSRMDQRCSIPF
jgi:hypothetical protein